MDIPPRIFSVLFFTVLMGRPTCKQITLTEIQIITNTERGGGGGGEGNFYEPIRIMQGNKRPERERRIDISYPP